ASQLASVRFRISSATRSPLVVCVPLSIPDALPVSVSGSGSGSGRFRCYRSDLRLRPPVHVQVRLRRALPREVARHPVAYQGGPGIAMAPRGEGLAPRPDEAGAVRHVEAEAGAASR